MASIRQISKRAGVSVATVSRVLNNSAHVDPKTRRQVLAAVASTGYVKTVGRQTTTVVGLVYPDEPVRADYGAFESAVLSGIVRGVSEQRFDLNILSLQRDKEPTESYTQFFRRKQISGVMLRSFSHTRQVCEAIAGEAFPAVVIADRFEEPAVNFVCCESRQDSRRAIEHLAAMGHRRIAIAMHEVPDTDHLDRLAGYEDALREAELPIDPALRIQMVANADGGASAVTRLLTLPHPPTALFLTDPLATLGALRRCQELGVKVPSEFSIVGFDDSDVRTHTFPRLTAVVQDAEMLGFEAARWLTRFLGGMGEPSLRLARSTRLEINQSTSVPPSAPVRVLPDGTRIAVHSR
jgi:LacI family transcriptional regulator